MTPTGHIGASIILANSPRLIGKSLSQKQQLAIVIAGNYLDIDHLIPIYTSFAQSHHNLPSHTPIFSIIVWAIYYFSYGKKHQPQYFNLMMLLAPLIHLGLDDLGYWLFMLGLNSMFSLPEINWFYPFSQFILKYTKITRPLEFIDAYFHYSKLVVGIEMLFISIAAVLQIEPHNKRK